MRKITITGISVLLLALSSNAQVKGGDPKFDKLFDFFVMEKYEDCAYKAESYSLNDKYRRYPEPYLYMAMCYVKINDDLDNYDPEQYKNPLKDAFKYAYKARQKSDYQVKKEIKTPSESIYEENKEFFMELKKLGIQEAKSWMVEENWRKAASQLKAVVKFVPEDYSIRMMKGACEMLNKNIGQGSIDIKLAVATINQNLDAGTIEKDKVSDHVGVDAFIKYTDWLVEQQMSDSAKVTIELASRVYQGDADIRAQYDKINN